jgi:hypothetical protein
MNRVIAPVSATERRPILPGTHNEILTQPQAQIQKIGVIRPPALRHSHSRYQPNPILFNASHLILFGEFLALFGAAISRPCNVRR